LADYAALISSLRQSPDLRNAPVIAIGGSYGGMLAAWMRQKYPHLVAGAIAASAPVLAFPGLSPPFDATGYWRVVTRDFAMPLAAGGTCADRIRDAWPRLFALAATAVGRRRLGELLRLCGPAPGPEKGGGARVGLYLAMALDAIAMANYPYPSAYLTGGPGSPPLPAWPARAACAALEAAGDGVGDAAVAGLGAAAAVYNNASGAEACLTLPEDESYAGLWDYQW
jgi:lysosomal Pro-X carboxypeptidase